MTDSVRAGGPSRRTPGGAGALVGELVGTYILILFGTGAVVATKGEDLLVAALAFGLAVTLVIYALGHASGAHVNPAVTVALAAIGKFPARWIAPYVAAQAVGGILASLTLLAIFGSSAADAPLALGTTAPGEGFSGADAFLAELVITAILLVIIVGTATDERADAPAVGLGVGFTVVAGILAMGPVSGASFNPVRTFAPAIVSGEFTAWAAYLAGPLLGAVAGAVLYDRVIRGGSPPAAEGAVEEHRGV